MTRENPREIRKMKEGGTFRLKPVFRDEAPTEEDLNLSFDDNEWEASDEWGFELD